MKAVRLRARRRRRRRGRAAAGDHGATLPRRRHEPRRPDEARRRAARAARRRHAACRSTTIEELDGRRRCGSARRSATATSPRTRCVRERYPVLAQARARRRVGPAAQHGDRRRQPAAAHALPLLPGRHEAVQQARARLGLPGASRASTATTRSSAHSEHCVATHPSDMAVALAALDATSTCTAPTASARSRCPACTGCPATSPQRDTVLDAGRPDHRRRAAAAGRAAALGVPQGARPRVLRVRAGLGRRRARTSTTARCSDVPDRARRRRARAVAGASGRGRRCAARRAERGGVRARRPTPSSPRRAAAAATTPSRCRWPATCCVRTLAELTAMSIADERAVGTPARAASTAASRSPARRRYAFEHPIEGVAYAAPVGRHHRRAARSTPIDPAPALGLPGVLAVLSHDNAPSARRDRRRRAAAVQCRHRRTTAGRSSPRWWRRRSSRRARPPPRSASTTRRASHDVELRADHPRLYKPDKVNPSFPDRHRSGRRGGGARTRGGPGRPDLRHRPPSTTTRWSRTPASPIWEDGDLARLRLDPGHLRRAPHARPGVRARPRARARDRPARRRRLRLQGHAAPAGGARRDRGAAWSSARSSSRSRGSRCSPASATARRRSSASASAPTPDGTLTAIAPRRVRADLDRARVRRADLRRRRA